MARTLRAATAIAAIAALAALIWWASARPSRPAEGPSAATTPPVRGGTLVASLRSEPGSFNRFVERSAAVEVIAQLTQARLVRIDRVTGDVEPWLAESWTESADHRTFTLKLRRGVTFSDGSPFSAADVLFSFRAVYDPELASDLAAGLLVNGQPLKASAPDDHTVVITLPAPFAPGLSLLDNLPILPRHQLEAPLNAHRFRQAWGLDAPPRSMAGLGPFVVAEFVPGQRITLERNPHYWRTDTSGAPLPYLDRIDLVIVPDQNAEILRLETGAIDLMAQGELRPEDYASARRLQDEGTLTLLDAGVGVDPNMLWFNLTPARARDPRSAWLQRVEFRRAIAFGVDRDAIVNAVYLGAAVPIFGPITPGNRTWYSADAPRYPHDAARAKALLAGLGLSDRNGDGLLEDRRGAPVRFSILTQRGHTIRERTAAVLQAQLRALGITVDVATLDPPSMIQRWSTGDYDSIYFGVLASSLDPANNLDFWMSSGSFHFWNPSQPSPATPWEREIDELMTRQVAAPTLAERQALFARVQQMFGEQLPAIYFVAPRVTVAMSTRVRGATPAVLEPKILWNPDVLYLAGPRQ